MKDGKRWVLALVIAAAGVFGGAGGVAAATAEDATTGSTIAGHNEVDESPDNSGKDKAGETGKGDSNDDDQIKSGDSSDKVDDDTSDANDTDGPGDDEDD